MFILNYLRHACYQLLDADVERQPLLCLQLRDHDYTMSSSGVIVRPPRCPATPPPSPPTEFEPSQMCMDAVPGLPAVWTGTPVWLYLGAGIQSLKRCVCLISLQETHFHNSFEARWCFYHLAGSLLWAWLPQSASTPFLLGCNDNSQLSSLAKASCLELWLLYSANALHQTHLRLCPRVACVDFEVQAFSNWFWQCEHL